jgi:polysaccharide biosynthesis protein PslJ
MSAVERTAEPRGLLPSLLVGGPLLLLTAAVVSGTSVRPAAVLLVVGTVLALARPLAISWTRLLATLILIILFIPMRRYTLPASLPFQLEPYRIFVAFLVLAWGATLLVDRRLHLRRTGFEGPLIAVVGAAFASVIANPARVQATSSQVTKSLMFLLSFVLVLYLLVSTIRRLDEVDSLVKTLVVGGAIVSFFAIIEARTGFNVFNHLSRVIPILHGGQISGPEFLRVGTGKSRVFASAEHPIALSAALVMLAPLALYLARRYRQRRWLLCAGLIGIACASTVSRTAVVMFFAMIIVFVWLRPRETVRLWPALIPLLLAVHFVLPGTLGAIKNSFMPSGGLIAEQQAGSNLAGGGRLSKVGPALVLWKQEPLFGQGYGTQVVDLNAANVKANFFDDQWLGMLLATGVLGVFAWLWLFKRTVGRFAAEAKRDDSYRGWLLASIASAIVAYAVGMLTYDAFAFIQVTFLLFILIGLGSALLAERPTPLAMRSGTDR